MPAVTIINLSTNAITDQFILRSQVFVLIVSERTIPVVNLSSWRRQATNETRRQRKDVVSYSQREKL